MATDAQIKTEKLFIDSLFNESVGQKKISPGSILGIKRMTGDASSRRYYRLDREKDRFVVCLQQPKKKTEKDDFIILQKIYKENGIRVPEIYDFDLAKGYLLEEDLGDQTLLKKVSTLSGRDEELKTYRSILSSLIKIQSIPIEKYNSEDFTHRFFDEEKLMWEVDFTITHLIEGFLKAGLGDKDKLFIKSEFSKICKKISQGEMVVTHRDFHSRNIMIKNEEPIIIDFQDTRIGIPQYDLVSMLEDCYFKISSPNKKSLKKDYWENFIKPNGLQSSGEEYLYSYDLMAIQRVFKALGSFGYIHGQRNDIRYLKYIGFSFEKLRDIMFRHTEFNELRSLLSGCYYEN